MGYRFGDRWAAGDLIHKHPQLLALEQKRHDLLGDAVLEDALGNPLGHPSRLDALEHEIDRIAGEQRVERVERQLAALRPQG